MGKISLGEDLAAVAECRVILDLKNYSGLVRLKSQESASDIHISTSHTSYDI